MEHKIQICCSTPVAQVVSSGKTRGKCRVCLIDRHILSRDSIVCLGGSVHNRCPGSHQPPLSIFYSGSFSQPIYACNCAGADICIDCATTPCTVTPLAHSHHKFQGKIKFDASGFCAASAACGSPFINGSLPDGVCRVVSESLRESVSTVVCESLGGSVSTFVSES